MQALYLEGYGAAGADNSSADNSSADNSSADSQNADSQCKALLSGEDGRSSEYPAFQIYLTPEGLALWPGFLPHAAGACAEVVTVPYARLRKFADPQGAYFRTVYLR